MQLRQRPQQPAPSHAHLYRIVSSARISQYATGKLPSLPHHATQSFTTHHRERPAPHAIVMHVTLAQALPPIASLKTLHPALLQTAPRSILTPRSTCLLPTSMRRKSLSTPTLIRPRACQMLNSPYYDSSEMAMQDIFHDFGVFLCVAAAAALSSPAL